MGESCKAKEEFFFLGHAGSVDLNCYRGMSGGAQEAAAVLEQRLQRLQVCHDQADALQQAAAMLEAGLLAGRAQVPAFSSLATLV